MSRHAELVMRAKLGVQRSAQLVQETEARLAKVIGVFLPPTAWLQLLMLLLLLLRLLLRGQIFFWWWRGLLRQ